MTRVIFGLLLGSLLGLGCAPVGGTVAGDHALARWKATAPMPPPAGEETLGTFQLTIADAIERALSHDARLRASEAEVAWAEARIDEVGQLTNPDIRVTRMRFREFGTEDSRFDLELRMRPPRPGELGAKQSAARSRRTATEAELTARKQQIAARVRWLYEEVRFIGLELEATDLAIATRRKLLSVAVTRADRGIGTDLDVSLSQLTLEESLQEAMALRHEGAEVQESLLELVGFPPGMTLRLEKPSDEEMSPDALPTLEALTRAALRTRAELAVAAAQIDAADADAYSERLRQIPWFSWVELGYIVDEDAADLHGWSFGLSFEVPLFSLNMGGVAAADARKAQREAQFDAEVARVVREIRERWVTARDAAETMRAMQAGAVVVAEKAAAGARAALVAGQVDVLGLALVEGRRASVERKRIAAMRRYRRAIARLQEAVGGEWPESIE